jgi:hypothetical protein
MMSFSRRRAKKKSDPHALVWGATTYPTGGHAERKKLTYAREGMGKYMLNKREKGKIPRSEWSTILARYAKGDTIAQIARDYGCTAPAIRYIVKRNGMLTGRGRIPGVPPIQPGTGPSSVGGAVGPIVWPSGRGAPTPAGARRGHQILAAELRRRVSGDIASFLVSLDRADLEGSRHALVELQEASDRLMRSIARTRLELEHLMSEQESKGTRDHARRKVGARS